MEQRSSGKMGSLRSSTKIWREAQTVFSTPSTRDEDDEMALKWAALEKLPTYQRTGRGILRGAEGSLMEFDVQNMRDSERKILLGRLIRDGEEDNGEFLKKLRDRLLRVGLELPTVEVRFEQLKIQAEVRVGTRALPTVSNYFINKLETPLSYINIIKSHEKSVDILQSMSGIIKPNRMTLLLGPPASGKTSLLLALAGRLSSALKVSGRITYNGHGMDGFVPQRSAAYISQHDLHIGEMTVRETLAFSARCQGTGTQCGEIYSINSKPGHKKACIRSLSKILRNDPPEMLAELSRREKASGIKPDPDLDVFMKAAALEGQEVSVATDYILKILGLDICADTFVGNEMLRGVSGGQRKRVTTGEMIVGPAKALFMDEISSGLDSSTTFQIVRSLRQSIHILGGTAVISLLQPAPETYNLFDDIILLSDGQIVYQGPREHILEFFESMGFKCPKRKGVADFLQEVTSRKDQKQYWMNHDKPYHFVPAEEFAEAFQQFHVGQRLRDELAVPFDKSRSHPAALSKSRYGVTNIELLKACTARELLLMKRNMFVYVFTTSQLLIMAFITMTVFLRTKMKHETEADGVLLIGEQFFAVSMIMFNGYAEISMTSVKLPIFFKQRDLLMFPAWAYALPAWILKILITLVEVAGWVFISYYVIGFDPNAGRLFKQYLILLMVSQMASALFRFLSVLARNITLAPVPAGLTMEAILVLGGVCIRRGKVKKWWKWGYWSSPLMYAQTAISTNEFLGESWGHVLPNSTESLGISVLKSTDIFTESKWYWIGVGALAGYVLLLNGFNILALTYLNPPQKAHAAVPEDLSKEEHLSTRIHAAGIMRGNSSSRSMSVHDEASTGSNERRKGVSLSFVPLSLTFEDIKYSVDMPQEMTAQGVQEDRLVLLKGVSGAFRPGVLTALMGVSGAGKTTLMDVLAGRKTGGYIEGNITVSGYPKKQKTFARVSGYCEQTDIHSPNVTVHESLIYSAWLRLPAEIDSETRKMFVEEVMELVELTSLKGALVGLPGVDGLSTEQRKRLTIAVELVANPSIIFMDEPTSGLDARAAAIVMRAVRNTVDTGRTVVCTIHQPSIDIFEAFDELFLMKRGGQEIYVGPLGHNSCHLIEYFESITGVSKITEGYNPSTWMLEVTTASQEAILGVNFSDMYRDSELYQRNKALIRDLSSPPPGSDDLYFPTQHSQSYPTQFVACLWKQWLSYWRNPIFTAWKFIVVVINAFITGTMFWDLGSKAQERNDLQISMASLYVALMFVGVQCSQSMHPVVSIERTVYYRESAAGMYSAWPYALAQIAIEIPYVLLQSLIYVPATYAMIGFKWTASKFFWNLFYTYFTLLYFAFFGMMAVALTPNQSIASLYSVLFYNVWNLFAGFVIPRPRTSGWWRWVHWASPVSWTLYGLVASQFGDVEERLETGETVAEFIRDYLGFKHSWLGVAATVIIGFCFLFAFIYAIATRHLNFQKR